VVALTEPTVRLDLDNEPQPDVVLARRHIPRPPQQGQYFEGVPELVVEIAASSASYDLHDKLNAYRRTGVQEYIVWRVYEEAIDWFALREGEYKPLAADAAGVVASEVFPGLQLDVKAMLAGDIAAVLKAQSVTG
jgi:Uma2 family endonuclease